MGSGAASPGRRCSRCCSARPSCSISRSNTSYGAVGGILLLASPRVRRSGLAGLPPWWHPRKVFVAAFVSSIAAQLPVLSLTASSFVGAPLFSPLVNLLAIPLTTLLVPLGDAAAILGLLLPAAGAALNVLTGQLAELLIRLIEHAARLPTLPWGEISNTGHFYWLMAVLALACAVARVLQPSRASTVVLCALLASSFTPPAHPQVEFVALDVGQGDSVLLRFPGCINVLIEGGAAGFSDFPVGKRIVLPALSALGVNHLDMVIATHADFDHMGGLPDVLALLPVQQLVLGQDESDRTVYAELLDVAAARSVVVRHVRRGERLQLGSEVELVALNPRQHHEGASNDESVGIEVHYRGVNQALLLGDLPISAERALTPAPARILLVPHYGSRYSTSTELLRQVQAEHAVISLGRNNYGHPHPSVLQRLEAAGVRDTRRSQAEPSGWRWPPPAMQNPY